MNVAETCMSETMSFCLTVSFRQEITSPHLLFQTISDMILELQEIDRSLVQSIDSKIEPVFVLDEVEKGSIKIWLKQFLENIPDEALADLDAKKIIGNYLVRGKHKILQKMNESDGIKEVEKLDSLALELQLMAKSTNILMTETMVCVNKVNLLTSMNNLGKIANKMPEGSEFFYSIDELDSEDLIINKNFESSEDLLDEIIEENIIINKSTLILKVKQPDYLGNSQWGFRYDGSGIMCGIEDSNWLEKFHSREIDVRPGDSLKALVEIRTTYNDCSDVITQKYTVLEVLEVVSLLETEQIVIDMKD